MPDMRRSVGKLGEDIACEYLSRRGFTILSRNFRRPWGEIDIIAEKGGVVRIVEVKAVSREIGETGVTREMDYRPEELVDTRKLRKLAKIAETYMEENSDNREYQIDVVGVVLDAKAKKARCRLIEQALEDNI